MPWDGTVRRTEMAWFGGLFEVVDVDLPSEEVVECVAMASSADDAAGQEHEQVGVKVGAQDPSPAVGQIYPACRGCSLARRARGWRSPSRFAHSVMR